MLAVSYLSFNPNASTSTTLTNIHLCGGFFFFIIIIINVRSSFISKMKILAGVSIHYEVELLVNEQSHVSSHLY